MTMKKLINQSNQKQYKQLADSTPPATGDSDWIGNRWFHLLLVVMVGLVAYSNSFTVPFMFDDDTSIVNNPVIKDLGKFLSGDGYVFNPRRFVGYLSIALNYHFGGLNVIGYHVVNLTIHIMNALLVYALTCLTLHTPFLVSGAQVQCMENPSVTSLRSSSITTLMPLFAALLFVAHPIQTQAVTYIIQRLASLATFFYLASVVCYARGRITSVNSEKGVEKEGHSSFTIRHSPDLWYVLALFSALIAMRTKEIAATLPLAIMLYEFSFFSRLDRKKALLILVPIAVTLVIVPMSMLLAGKPFGELLSDASQMSRETTLINRPVYFLTQIRVISTYLRLLVFPVGQNLDYEYFLYDSFFLTPVILSTLLHIALIGGAVLLFYMTEQRGNGPGKRAKPVARLIFFGVCWFYLALMVESSIIPIVDVIFEHRLYLPSVGFVIAIAALAELLGQRYSMKAVCIPMACLILAFGVATWKRNVVWADSLSLWEDTVAKSPNKDRPHYSLAYVLMQRKRFPESIQHLKKAISLNPDIDFAKLGARVTLASLYERTGDLDLAIGEYEGALEYSPDEPVIHAEVATLYGKKGLIDKAINHSLAAIRLKPELAHAHKNLGTAYLVKGNIELAKHHLEEAIKIDPDIAEVHNNLGILAMKRGEREVAMTYFERAIQLKPENRDYKENLAIARQGVRKP